MRECRAGDSCRTVGEIQDRYDYIKQINSKSSGQSYHVIKASDGYHAFVKMNGRYYATDTYTSLVSLESFVF